MESDIFYTIAQKTDGEFKDKGSKFIAFAFPFFNVEDLKKHLDAIKSIHPKARHFCFAYKIHENFRSNDDGEPSGSAGKPILNAILSKNLDHILIIVVRYFGGTLLGVPGLITAYKSASLEAIANAKIETKFIKKYFSIKFEFEKTNDIMRIVKEFDMKILEQNYTDKCEMKIEIRQSLAKIIARKFEELRFVNFSDE